MSDDLAPSEAAAPPPPPALFTPAMQRAVELARELLRERGLSEEEIDRELKKPPGSGFASF